MEIIDRATLIAEEYLDERGIEIVEVIYRREQQGMVLRLVVDKPEGITIAECEEINNFLSAELDKQDIIQERYVLEVSSPGLDRPIKTERDFERAMGKQLEITTYERIDDRKTHEGRFLGMDKENIVIEKDGVSVVIPKNKIALARLKIDF
ncbi:MAG: ribosome maturation factor RimP [Candidatus Omnitrophota bacterium]|jgi:ribosome maturation factor RimP